MSRHQVGTHMMLRHFVQTRPGQLFHQCEMEAFARASYAVFRKIMYLQLYGAFSGFSFPNFSHKCKCRVLDTRTRPKKDLQHLPMFLFLPQERSQDSAHPSVRVPLSQAQRHAPSS